MWCMPSFAWMYDYHLLWTQFVVWQCFWCTLNAQCIWILCDAYIFRVWLLMTYSTLTCSHACLTNTNTFYSSFPKWHVSSHVFSDIVTFDVVMWCIPSFAWMYGYHLIWTEFVVWQCCWCTLNAQCIWILCDAYHLSGLTLDDIFNTDMLV